MNTRFPFVTRRPLTLVLAAWVIAANTTSFAAETTNAPNKLDYTAFSMVPERNIFNPNRVPRLIQTERREVRRVPRAETLTFVGTMQYDKGYVAFFDGSEPQYKRGVRLSESIAGFKLAEVSHNLVKLNKDTNGLTLQIGMQMRREEEGAWILAGRSETIGSRSSYEGSRPSSISTAFASPFDRSSGRDASFLRPTQGFNQGSNQDSGGRGGRDRRGSGGGFGNNNFGGNFEQSPQPVTVTAAPVTAAPPATDASNEDIIKRLMERREQEMNK